MKRGRRPLEAYEFVVKIKCLPLPDHLCSCGVYGFDFEMAGEARQIGNRSPDTSSACLLSSCHPPTYHQSTYHQSTPPLRIQPNENSPYCFFPVSVFPVSVFPVSIQFCVFDVICVSG